MAVRRRVMSESDKTTTCLSKPSIYHAAVIIFLEFFAFGLLTTPMISVLDETFPKHTFLMNGIIQGIKGFLSFLSAPLLGALSDALGRKPFLLLTVTFTCSPIPLMKISPWWYFAMISISGVFAVTFSVVLAYVADITTEDERSWAYGLVSATFAASLICSPAIGAYLGRVYSEELVVALATAIALLDILFILACVPESLPEKVRLTHWCAITGRSASSCSASSSGSASNKISWEKVDPFAALRKVTKDYLVLILCITTFFSYLPEAGQYSCFFIYLRLAMGFSEENVALFIAVGGILSCISQTFILGLLNTVVGPKRAIIIGLVLEAIQLGLYGFCTDPALLWTAGLVAAMGTVTYPALSAFVSKHASADQQGVAQGLVAGIRGLCGGLGPALFGLIFYIFRVDLNSAHTESTPESITSSLAPNSSIPHLLIPGPPFAFGAILVLLAILVAWFIPDNPKSTITTLPPTPSIIDSGGSGSILIDLQSGSGVNRLRRHSPTTSELINEFGSDYIECSDNNNTSLLDGHRKTKSTRIMSKDHILLANNHDAGVWGRLFSAWTSSDRRRYPPASRRPRLFRHPTVSFTRAHLIEPVRRLLMNLGGSLTPTPTMGTQTDTQSNKTGVSQYTGSTEFASDFATNTMHHPNYIQSRHETEAADLSNYRSQYLKQFLTTSASILEPQSPATSTYHSIPSTTPLLSSCVLEEEKVDQDQTDGMRISFLNDFDDGNNMTSVQRSDFGNRFKKELLVYAPPS